MPSERPPAGKATGPKEWVRRLVRNQAVTLDERQLGWWTFHLEGFLRYCRRRGDQVEAKILVRGYFDELSGSEPPVASLRIDQTRQALTVFLRGITSTTTRST